MQARTGFVLLVLVLTSCTLTKPVKTGDMAYEFKQYGLAIELLEEEYNKEKNQAIKARKALYLAYSYDMLERYGEALPWYDVADQMYENENSSLELAQSLKKNERYKEASKLFEDMYGKYRTIDYRKQAEICRIADDQMNNLDNYKVKSLPLNSPNSEYSPVYFEDDFIIFSSDRESSTGSKVYKWNDRSYSDLFVADRDGRQVYNFDAVINTENNEGTVAFSKDFQEIFFTRCFSDESRDQHCKLYYSQRPNGFWLEPEALMFYDDNINFAHPCLIENDSVLIFAAKPQGSNNYDLYYSVRLEKGWSEADIMPSKINSSGDEMFPTSYGDTLYFASDGLLGFGGLDIFKTVLNDDGSWSNPENMGWPINSGADDFGLVPKPGYDKNKNIMLEALFSSSRNTGSSTDIFNVIKYNIPDEEVEEELVEETEEEEREYLVYISGEVTENKRENDDPNAAIISRRAVDDGQSTISFGDSSLVYSLDNNGRFLHRVTKDQLHKIRVNTRDHLTREVEVQIPDLEALSSDTTINVAIALDRIIYDQEIIISNIYYDFNRWEIRDDAEAPLDSLADVLKLNNQLDIELASHTDCRGDDDYNLDLSQKRAQSVVDYLVSAQIDSSRLVAKGYGETKLYIDCVCEECTEEEHQANRRTTFKILKPE